MQTILKNRLLLFFGFIGIVLYIPMFLYAQIQDLPTSEDKEDWSNQPIIDIKYRCDADFSEKDARSVTTVQIGQIYSRSEIRKSIERIYALGNVSDVKVDAQLQEKGISLTFIITKKIETRNISIIGNRNLSRSEIIKAIKLKSGQGYNDALAENDLASIKKLYASFGYLNAKISYTNNLDIGSNQMDVTFNIVEGGQPIITKIIFTGTNEAVVRTKDLLKTMRDIKLGGVYKGEKILKLDAKRIEEIYREREYLTTKISRAIALSDPESIKEFEGKGRHFDAKNIDNSVLKDGSVVILIEIDQGERVYIQINGNNNIKEKEIKNAIAIQRMRSVSQSLVNRSRDDVEKLYKTRGYYLVNVKSEILNDIVWDFKENSEGWETVETIDGSPFNVSNGLLKMSQAYKIQSSAIQIDTKIYKKLQIRMRIDTKRNNDITVYSVAELLWTTNRSKEWNQKKSKEFEVIVDDQFHDYEVPLNNNKSWSDIITQIQVIPVKIPNAKVDIEWIKVSTEFIPVIFEIKENKQMRITKPISIIGANSKKLEIDEKDIKKQILTKKKSFWSFWVLKKYFPNGILDEDVLLQDLRAIVAFYKDKGYTAASVEEKPWRVIDAKNGDIEVTIAIDEGPRTFVTEVKLDGNRNAISDEDILSHLSVVPNFDRQNLTKQNSTAIYTIPKPNPFREYDLIADRSYLSLQYADKGYLANIEPIKQFRNNLKEAIITYQINQGKQIKLDGKIDVIGNVKTKRRIIDRELYDVFSEDKVFNFSKMEKGAQRIRSLGIFEAVRTDVHQVGKPDEPYRMIISVKEKKSRSINTHIGYNSLEGFDAGIDAADINIGGTARRITGNVQIGTQRQRVEAEYIEPRLIKLLGNNVAGVVDFYPYLQYTDKFTENNKVLDYKEIHKGVTSGVSWSLFRKNTIKLVYRYDVIRYNDVTSPGNIERTSKIGRIETTFQRDVRDTENLLNPSKGSFNELTLEYANSKLGGTENFTKLSSNNMYYLRLFDSFILALNGRAGYSWNLGGALAPELFRMRDYQTPRGFKWSATDIGSILLNTSMEIRFPIYKIVNGAVFFDSGKVYDDLKKIDIRKMQSSVGLGVRIISPIGPIGLDFGYPIRGDGKRKVLPDIVFGHTF